MNTHPEQWAAMLQRPGSSWGFGALLKDTSVVVLKEEKVLVIHSPTNNPCRTWDSNPQPLDYKSDSLTIRPRLPPFSIAMVGETMCLYNGSQWCSVYGEEEGSNNWSLRKPCDQLMFFGYLYSPENSERPTCDLRFKPVECRSCDGRQEILMIHSFKSGR